MTETIEPHNREAEEATLGAVLINPSNHYPLAGFLKSSDFYIHRNGWIWEAFGDLVSKRIPIDALTIAEELDRRGRLAEAGGGAYILQLMNSTPVSINSEHYGRMVKEDSVRRQMLVAASEIARKAHDTKTPIEEILTSSVKLIKDVSDQPNPDEEIPDALEVAANWAEAITTQKHYSIPTGISKLDRFIGGLEPKTVMMFAGRPGLGKTAGMWQIARNIATAKHKTLFVSLEMATDPLWGRAACGLSEVMWKDIRSGKATKEDLDKAIDASTKLAHVYQDFLLIDDKPRTTDKIARICAKYRPEVLIIDHLRFIKDKNPNEVKRLGGITEFFHDFAKQEDIAVVILCQLSRRTEFGQSNKVPTLDDLRDSGEIEENADSVIMLHWPHPESYNSTIRPTKIYVDWWIRKFRNGEANIQLEFSYDVIHQWFEDRGQKEKPKARMEMMEPTEPEIQF